MTNDDYEKEIIELAKKNNIPYIFQRTKHYGKYPYMLSVSPDIDVNIVSSIQFNLDSTFGKNIDKIDRSIDRLHKLKEVNILLQDIEIRIQCSNDKSEFRREKNNICKLMMINPQEVYGIIKDYARHISVISSPMIGEAKKKFIINTNHVNRKILYYSKYRYKLIMDSYFTTFYDSIYPDIKAKLSKYKQDTDWMITGLYEYDAVLKFRQTGKIDPGYQRRSGRWRREPSAQRNFKIYFSDEELYAFFKLMYDTTIIGCTEVILDEEIADIC